MEDATNKRLVCVFQRAVQHELKEVFSCKISGAVSTSAVIDGDRLFFGSEDGALYCIDKNTGEEMIPKKKTKGTCQDIHIGDKTLIVISDKGQVEHFTEA